MVYSKRDTRKRTVSIISLSLFLVGILACVNTGPSTPDTSERNRMLSVLFDESQSKVFFARIKSFARSHNYEMLPDMTGIEHLRDAASLTGDGKIFVLVTPLTLSYDVSPNPTMIYFMGGDAENPTDEATKKEIDAQVSDLIELISDIPNIKITDVSCKQPDDKDWQRCLRNAFP
jgi:hypothetical protein